MAFGIGTFVDGINGAAPSGPTTAGAAPGATTRTQGMAPRSGFDAAVAALPIPANQAALNGHITQVRNRASLVRQVRSAVDAGSPALGACARVAELIGQALPHVQAVATYVEENHHRDQRATSQTESFNPFVAGEGLRTQDTAADQAPADARAMEDLHIALDQMMMITLDLGRLVGPSPEQNRIALAMTALAGAASSTGWIRPVDLEDATTREAARETCPPDSTRDACDLTPIDRGDLRNRVLIHLGAVVTKFGRECDQQAGVLKKAIERDQQLAEMIAGIILDVILIAATGGMGAAAVGALTATAATESATAGAIAATTIAADAALVSAEAAATTAFRASVRKFGADAAKALVKTTLNKGTKFAPGEPAPDARTKTIGFVDGLAQTFEQNAVVIERGLAALDDITLRTFDANLLTITPQTIRARIGSFVEQYRAQVEPIGETSTALGFVSRRDTVNTAARIHVPSGPPMLALVKYTSDALPQARRGARTVAAVAASFAEHHDLGDPALIADVPGGKFDDASLSEWVAAPYDEIEFIRWIDAPMSDIADHDAIDLPAERVQGLPFMGYLGIREAPNAQAR